MLLSKHSRVDVFTCGYKSKFYKCFSHITIIMISVNLENIISSYKNLVKTPDFLKTSDAHLFVQMAGDEYKIGDDGGRIYELKDLDTIKKWGYKGSIIGMELSLFNPDPSFFNLVSSGITIGGCTALLVASIPSVYLCCQEISEKTNLCIEKSHQLSGKVGEYINKLNDNL